MMMMDEEKLPYLTELNDLLLPVLTAHGFDGYATLS